MTSSDDTQKKLEEEQAREWREMGGKRLRATRNSAGFNQKQLAEAAGTNQSTISDWERGNASPTVAQLAKLLDTMGYTLKLQAEKKAAKPTATEGFGIFGEGRGSLKSG